MPTLNFVNAYGVYTSGGNLALKEQNSIDFTFTSLNVARVSDGTNGTSFSGNDVPVELTINGTSYYGWISRPIKVGGVVRGFYFWSDPDFRTLSDATTDGNMDGDSSAADNFGFVLVVDQAYFTQLAGNSAPGSVLNVGSSSDRVDTSLNAVLTINSAPVGVNDSVTINEDGAASGNVLANDTDANNDKLSVTAFSINGTSGTLGTPFVIANVGSFTLASDGSYTFTPLLNYTGAVPVVSYTLSDGQTTATAKLTIGITAVNDPPVASNDSVTVLEDTATLLSLADFGTYSDAESKPLASVQISTLPGAGSLQYFNGTSWIAVTAGQTITATDITAGRLRYTPVANSTAPTSLTFTVSDGGATSGTYTLSIGIVAVNDAPAGTDKTITLNEDSSRALTASDFGFSDASDSPANLLSSVIVTTLPLAGSLTLNGSAVTAGQTISKASIDSGLLVFTPASNANGSSYAGFGFKVQDDGGIANGGSNTDPTANTITFTVAAVNDDPVARNDAANAIYSATASYRVNPSGNVITNDTDVDRDTLSATRLNVGATLGGSPVVIGATQTVTDNYTIAGVETAVYNKINLKGANIGNIPSTGTVTGDGTTVIPAGTTYTKTAASGNSADITFTNSAGNVVLLGGTSVLTFTSGATSVTYTLANSGGAADTPTIDTTVVAISSATASLSGAATTIVSGKTVSGTGITGGTTVSAVYAVGSYQFVKLSTAYSSINDYTFSASRDRQVSGGAGVVDGTYGQLSLNPDGSYTYTVTNAAVTNGSTDTFTYEVSDPSSALATAQLVVTINTVSAAPPTVHADTKAVTEKYGTANGSGTSNATGNVLTDGTADTGASGLRVDQISSQTSTGPSSVNSNGSTSTQIAGKYGTLTILSGGGYTYQVDDANATVQALNSGGSVTDVFTYRATDSGGNYASTTLTVTVNGANDAPAAVDDAGSATEAGGTANATAGAPASGNVLTNDADVDSARAGWAVSAIRTGAVEGSGTAGTVGAARAGTYGSLTINSDGTYT